MSIFKRLFGIKKASKETDDTKIDYEVQDLKKGYILDYDLGSWEVQDVAVYTWDNGVKDFEYTIFDGKQKQYLNYETVGGAISIYWEENINDIWSQARQKIRRGQDIMDDVFQYKGNEYYYSGEASARVKSLTETYDMQNWLFKTDDDDTLISFNKYEDNSMDAYVGKKLSNHAVSNILPR